MGWVFDVEQGVKRVEEAGAERARPEPVLFRGVDCALLAERYVAYRRERGLDVVIPPLDLPGRAEVAARFAIRVSAPADIAGAGSEPAVVADAAALPEQPAAAPEASP